MTLLWRNDEPIIQSLLETDVYKFLMLNFIFRYYTNLSATFSFTNRTDVDLLQYIDPAELRAELAHVASLRFTSSDVSYLMSWGMFQSAFPQKLGDFSLEAPDVSVREGKLQIEAHGLWSHVSMWEIPTLAIVAELYGRGRAKAEGITEAQLYDTAMERVAKKVAFFKERPYLRASQFGLRRRFSGLWEKAMTVRMMEETSFFTGVSNVHLARELGVEAQGTNAHELPMAAYAYARGKSNFDARRSVYSVLYDWQQLYGQKALVMLPDAYGTTAFLDQLPDNFLYDWRGFRQDSGDARVFGDTIIARYHKFGIDPLEKLVIFSDGLTPEVMDELYQYFNGRIGVGFGVGTNLTNDMGLIKALSLVMKLTRVDGRPTVKLSDNIAKATGDAAEIAVAKHIFGYESTFNEAAVY